ncbi:hypothetical protein LPJ61_003762 [Coemansia biformis]|uniref:Pentacotripeptide-repeat region of PRORP domain-containing protein n=1 Tax=Coemansia biformis TaxID=1286918 RepID=A0A9W7YAL7_9FUNG|nr:hypothetical protein LPJ61_003762 [Coemansia biformis]
MLRSRAGGVCALLRSRAFGTVARDGSERAATKGTEEVWIKRRPLPTATSIEYAIPTDAYLLAQKFQQVVRSGKLDDAVAIVMQTKTRHQSAVVWNLVIGEYAKTGRLSRALRAYTEMRKRGFKPTQTTFTALLKACALSDSDKRTGMAEHLLASMADHGVEPSIINHNALLDVYQRQHDLANLMDRFNGLPSDGPGAPSLATYTIMLAACRRELQRQLAEMGKVPVEGDATLKPPPVDSRHAALVKGNVRVAFTALMELWTTYTEDACRRIDQPCVNTPRLEIDSHIVRTVLKACHAIYGENRSLGRRGIAIAEQVYGFDKDLGAAAAAPVRALALAPLAVRLRSGSKGAAIESAVVDSDVIDLVFGLCKRDKQYTKAIRFWRSLEAHFPAEIEPLREQHAERLGDLRSQMRIALPQRKSAADTLE